MKYGPNTWLTTDTKLFFFCFFVVVNLKLFQQDMRIELMSFVYYLRKKKFGHFSSIFFHSVLSLGKSV